MIQDVNTKILITELTDKSTRTNDNYAVTGILSVCKETGAKDVILTSKKKVNDMDSKRLLEHLYPVSATSTEERVSDIIVEESPSEEFGGKLLDKVQGKVLEHSDTILDTILGGACELLKRSI